LRAAADAQGIFRNRDDGESTTGNLDAIAKNLLLKM
jgi:hypothetical protein